jgi:predicted RNase H-like HicB family nuclease
MRIALPVPGTEPKMLMEKCIRVRMHWHVAGLLESDCGLRSGMQQQEGWWIGWIEEVPGVNSQGRTRAELLENLRDALAEALEMNRTEARQAANGAYEEVSITA